MSKVSEHFSLEEIICRCGCGQAYVDPKLFIILEDFRAYLKNEVGMEIHLVTHCVNRCVEHNNKFLGQGASPNSRHLKGRAWDGHGKEITIKKLHKLAKKAHKINILPGGLGFYSWGIHIDSGQKRTWGKEYKEEV